MRVARCWLAAFVMALGLRGGAAAQCTGGGTFTITSNPVAALFANPGFVDYDNGAILYTGTIAVTVDPQKKGQTYDVCVAAVTPDLGTAGTYTKPLSDLQWQYNGGPWTSANGTAQVIETNLKNTNTVVLNLRILLSWSADPPGSYGTALTFSASN